ncbi:MAG: aspartyl/glutamyl-tRNA amidotransferase subunit C [Treponema sp.]|jgi:aspartyl-tRNA(Asn)/glutamyl-tRNA(Gln) amidotransferase subunit C|nr:aspartyl/glutamyl-tRNA amidotransferase subunit C [Treponema sp.]
MEKSLYMKIEDLKETAALARLNMDEKELTGAFPAFEQMLEYFAAMQAADRDETAFGASVSPGDSVFSGLSAVSRTVREDYFRPDTAFFSSTGEAGPEGGGNPDENLNENLLNNAGERDGRFLVIPNVL